MSASSKNVILSKGTDANTKTGEIQFFSQTDNNGLGKISFNHDATPTNRSLKFSVDSNEVLINNKGTITATSLTGATSIGLDANNKINFTGIVHEAITTQDYSNYDTLLQAQPWWGIATGTGSASEYANNDSSNSTEVFYFYAFNGSSLAAYTAAGGHAGVTSSSFGNGGAVAAGYKFARSVGLVESQYEGRIGIGTTTPATNLDVNGSLNVTNQIQFGTDDTDKIYFSNTPKINGPKIAHSTGFSFDIYTGASNNGGSAWNHGIFRILSRGAAIATERMRIDNVGNVGIGTTAPTAELEVKGKISNYGEAGYPSRFTSLALNVSSAASQYVSNGDFSRHNINGSLGGGTTTTLTLEAWVYTVDTQDYQFIVMKGNYGWGMYLKNSDKSIGYAGIGTGYSPSNQPNSNANAYALNEWQHIAVTVNTSSDTIKFYVNGINVGTNTGNNVRIIDCWNSVATRSLWIGAQGLSAANCFRGYIADVRIWTAELSQSTIQDWMKKDLIASHPNTSSLGGRSWTFDLTNNSTVYHMLMETYNGASLTYDNTWTETSRSGRVEAPGLQVIGNAAVRGNIRLEGNLLSNDYVEITQSALGEWYSGYGNYNNQGLYFKFNSSVWSISYVNGDDLGFSWNGGASAYVGNGTSATIMNFTGQHRSFINQYTLSELENLNGLIVSANKNQYTRMSNGLVTGCNAITINESLPDISITIKDLDKSVFGVISDIEDVNNRKDSYGVFVTPFKMEEGDTRPYINSVGEGAIWVTDKNGNLESGDYITSSSIPGYGMKQNSDSLKNYTVAKITMDSDFNPVTQPVKVILKDSNNANILDSKGFIQWQDHATKIEKAYNIRYLLADGTQITETDYTTRQSNGESVYKAAFVGCTYHCG